MDSSVRDKLQQPHELQKKPEQLVETASPNGSANLPAPPNDAAKPVAGGPFSARNQTERVSKSAIIAASKKYATSSLNPAEKWNSVYDLDDARKGVWQNPTEIIGNLLLAQSALLVSAHPHSMKSLAFLQAAIEAPARGKVWGHFLTPHVTRTLFIETEDPPWLVQERIRGLTKGLGIKDDEDVSGFKWICPGPFDLVKEGKELANLLKKHEPDFVVISTLQNIIPGRDMNEQRDMAPINKGIILLARQYCPVVMITHSTWDKNNRRALGTITQTANYATTLHFEKSGDRVTVRLDSKLGCEEQEFSLALETEEVSNVDNEEGTQKKKEVRRLVYAPKKSPKKASVEAAMEHLGGCASAEQIASVAGVSARYVRKIRAAKEGELAEKVNKHPATGGRKTTPAVGLGDLEAEIAACCDREELNSSDSSNCGSESVPN